MAFGAWRRGSMKGVANMEKPWIADCRTLNGQKVSKLVDLRTVLIRSRFLAISCGALCMQ